MKQTPFAYFVNHYNFNIAQKTPSIKICLTKKTLVLTRLFYELGAIKNFIITTEGRYKFILFSTNQFRSSPYFKSIRQISRPSKQYNISYKMLKLLIKTTGQAIIILSTSYGIITHKEALRRHTGGAVLFMLL